MGRFRYFWVTFIIFLYSTVAWAAVHYKDASKNKIAQQLFDNAMLDYYGYSYVQAEYNFRQALLYDPNCAICFWGLALAKKHQALELGQPFAKIGVAYLTKAAHLVSPKNTFQYDVIEALKTSFSLKPLSDEKLQIAYINSLKKLYEKYKDNKEWQEESLALLVDAIAYLPGIEDGGKSSATHCTHPSMSAYKQEALDLLTSALNNKTWALHPGLLHTYIHLAERNTKDPLGLVAAKELPSFSGQTIAHYTHMPTHIYWRRGMYQQAIQTNLKAIEIDNNYFKNNGAGLNAYYYEYHYLHSHHFLTALGILTNNHELAIKYARTIKALMDVNRMEDLKEYRDVLFSLEHLVQARFNRWEEVLNLPIPEQTGELGLLFIHFTQSLAYLNLGQKEKFENLFNQIKNTNYEKEHLIEFKTLVISYLQALAMDKASLTELEKVFLTNQVDKIENKLSAMNPPLWFFPYELFLSNAAKERHLFEAAKRYHLLFEKRYPNSSLGTNN